MGAWLWYDVKSIYCAFRDENGTIIGATSVTMTWLGEVDVDAITEEDLAAAEDGIAVRKMRLQLRIQCTFSYSYVFGISAIHFGIYPILNIEYYVIFVLIFYVLF